MSIEINQLPRYQILKALASMYASLPVLIAWRAGYSDVDLPALIFRVAELYGIMETAGVLLDPKCEKAVTEDLLAYKRYFEEALAYLITERYDKDRIEALTKEDLFNLMTHVVALIEVCLKGEGQ